jgi:large subunit ribosomal protein L3
MASVNRKSRKALLGKKLGMTQLFTEGGSWTPVTVLQVGPCVVLQVKTEKTDGYSAVQLGFGDKRRAKRPQQAQYDRIGTAPKRFVREVPLVQPDDLVARRQAGGDEVAAEKAGSGVRESGAGETGAGEGGASAGEACGQSGRTAEATGIAAGDVVGVKAFRGITKVDVRGVTKGRGFAGTIRRYRFNAGDKSHGSKNIREPGSTGMHTDPGRVHKGKRMPGHMGHVNRKARNLRVVQLDEERNLLLVKGSVPGPNGGFVYIEESLEA